MESDIKAEDIKDCMMPLSSLTEQEDISPTGTKEISEDAHTELMKENRERMRTSKGPNALTSELHPQLIRNN
ncbi:hypothetical protein ILUMI_19369 [Ignelater luminosus]|uniref:Uncharacterized protein n=1 Tax=Ignelater luminosus TaxID=2038154 RepID=A0A8K0CIB1_IGNLU|nr:hypothetical protein ILUMI_19369 [Ignelater luminosus]